MKRSRWSWCTRQAAGRWVGSPFAIEAIHRSYVERCLDPDSLETIEAELLLAPPDVEEASGRFVARTAGGRFVREESWSPGDAVDY